MNLRKQTVWSWVQHDDDGDGDDGDYDDILPYYLEESVGVLVTKVSKFVLFLDYTCNMIFFGFPSSELVKSNNNGH